MAFPCIISLSFDIKKEQPDQTLKPLKPDKLVYNKQKNIYNYSDRNEQIFYEGQISNGKRNGFGVEYYQNHHPKISGYFLNDKLEGSFNKFFAEAGNTIFIGKFVDEKPSLGIVFHPNGAMKFAGTFKDWKIEGERVYFFYDDSSLQCMGRFIEGKPQDENLEIFHKNGVTWFKGYCKDDDTEGRACIYHNVFKYGTQNSNSNSINPIITTTNPNNNNGHTNDLLGTTGNSIFTPNTPYGSTSNLRRYNCYELIKSLEDNIKLYELNRENQLLKLFDGHIKNYNPEGEDNEIFFMNGKLNMLADFEKGDIKGKVIINDMEGRKVFEGRCNSGVLKSGRWENHGQKIGGCVDEEGLLRNFCELDNSKLFLYDLRVELKFDWRYLYHCQSYYNNSYLRILDPIDLNAIYEGFHRQKRFHGYGRYCLRGDLILEGIWNMEKLTGIAKDGQWHCKVENMPLNVADTGGFFGHGIKDYLNGFGRLYNYQRGKMLYQGNLVGGKKENSYCFVRNFRGNIVYVGAMVNDKYEGRGTLYFERSGKIKETGYFRNGLLHGDYCIRYTEYENVIEEGKFVDGVLVPV